MKLLVENKRRMNEEDYYSRGAQTFTLDEFEKELKNDMAGYLEWAAEEYGRKEAEARLKKMLSRVIRLTHTI